MENGSLLTLGQSLTLNTDGNHDNRSTMFFGNVVLPQEAKEIPPLGGALLFVRRRPRPRHRPRRQLLRRHHDSPGGHRRCSTWIDADLKAANANRAKVPWLVTLHHHGPFSSASHGEDLDVLRGRSFLVPFFDKYHVDMDVAGHDHNYERSLPSRAPPRLPQSTTPPRTGRSTSCARAPAPTRTRRAHRASPP